MSNRPVAILGGGLQGCCIALELAGRGVPVHLYERDPALMTRAAVVNEGKVHLGYVYGRDLSLATARTMIRGALAFMPFLTRHLGVSPARLERSPPYVYLVHRDSQRTGDEVAGYLEAVHTLVREAAQGSEDGYFGLDLRAPVRRWPARERDAEFDPAFIVDAFDTPEIAVEPAGLAQHLRERIAATPAIALHVRRTVRSVEEHSGGLRVMSDGPEGPARETYAHVVNALWDGRMAIDATLDQHPPRPWLYRLKYAIWMRPPHGTALPTVTVVLGPFGDLVAYRGGLVYLSWYPACMRGMSQALVPPDWPQEPAEALRASMLHDSMRAMADLVCRLRGVDLDSVADLSVRGSVIVAWGRTDIDDPASELHQRHAVGVASKGRYHSVNPGKLTMAPLFAAVTADRILA